MTDSRSARPSDEHRPFGAHLAYFGVAGILFAFWGVVAAFIIVVVIDAADGTRDRRRAEAAVQPTPVATAAPVLRPKPVGAPEAAERMVNFDTGQPAQHLFFHAGCADGILAVVTTDEIVLAEWPCEGVSVDRAELEPFLGKPVRIRVEGTELLVVESAGLAPLVFNVDSAWRVSLQPN